MARGSKIKKVVGKRGVSYRTTVDVGTDPATGKRKQKVLTAKTKQELETLIAQTLADVSRNVYFEPQKATVGEYLDYWLENYAKPNVEGTTYDRYEMYVRLHLKPAFGAVPVTKLTPAHVQEFLVKQAEKAAPKSVACRYKMLRQSLKHAVKWEIIPRNICDAVDPPKVPRKEADPLPVEVLNAITAALKGTYHEAITKVDTHTAARIGEVLALKRDDVHLNGDDPYLVISHTLKTLKGAVVIDGLPKGKKARRIDLEPATVTIFKARFKELAAEKLAAGPVYQDNGYIFCQADGRPYNPANYTKDWVRAVFRRTSIKAHVHQIRHTAATLMLEAGVPIHEVSKMLGHSSVAITGDIYGHVTPTGRRQAARKLAEALAGGQERQ